MNARPTQHEAPNVPLGEDLGQTERRVEWVISAGAAGVRLDRAIANAFSEVSRSRVKALIEARQVTLDGATITDPSRRVKPGQVVHLSLPEATEPAPRGQAIPLAIVHEDDDLIVIDKPAGMVVHPAPGNLEETLVNALIAHCGASLSGIGGVRRPGIVHRLDKDTSGLIVAAKNDAAHRALSSQFAAHTIERAYRAVVRGVPVQATGEISGNIGRSSSDRKRMAVVAGRGKPALTRYQVLRRFKTLASLLECRLATGRTHQIRVHLAALGHPLIGDPTYGRRLGRESPLPRFPRQALHARLLGFIHPTTGELLRFESPLPQDFVELLATLESL